MPKTSIDQNEPDQGVDAPEPVAKGPGHFLQAWRKAARPKVTGDALAEHLGVSRGTYSDYETGKIDISVKQLRKAADFLQVPLGYITQYHPDQVPPDMMEVWGGMTSDQQKTAVGVLKAIKAGTQA